MTNPLSLRRESKAEAIIGLIIFSAIMSLMGGAILMWISAILLPVGFGYWASAGVVALLRGLYVCIAESHDR